MKNPLRRLFAAVTALALLLLLPACGGGGPKSTAPAMGRYVESPVTLPAGLDLVSALRLTDDGALELLAYPNPEEGFNLIFMHLYRSADGGATWTEDNPAWLDFFNSEDSTVGAQFAAWAPDGTLWFLLSGDFGGDGDGGYSQRFARLEGEEVTVLDWAVPSASDGMGPKGFAVAENGDLLLDCWSQFLQVDGAGGGVKNVYTAATSSGSAWNDGWTLAGNTLVLSEYSRLVWYDLSTGKETRSLPCKSVDASTYSSANYRVMDFSPDGTLAFADPQGIFRVTDGSDTLERLADGTLTSLPLSSLTRQKLIALSDRYLVLTWSEEDSFRLLSYTYDPDVPTLPGRELTIWSLNEDPLVRQAVAAIQEQDSGVHVNYQVGFSGEDSVTADDALRALATQITAGKCPDVLVLDGLPIDSYVEKGVLADLSTRLEALDTGGALLSNIANAYRRGDGTAYAVPAQFQVPLMHGLGGALSSLTDLAAMADWLEAGKDQITLPFDLYTVEANLRFFYPALASSLMDSGGGMDGNKLRDFLLQIKRIVDLRAPEIDWSPYNSDFFFEFGALALLAGVARLDVGNLCEFESLYAAWTVDGELGGGDINTLFGADAFLPVTSLGISAQSKEQDLAWAFVETALSAEVQGKAVGFGMPVSAAAFDASVAVDDKRADGSLYYCASAFFDADGAEVPVELNVLYPPEAWRQQMADRFKGLDTPLLYDASVLQLILDGSADYLNGKADLDSAVNGILQKLKLFEAE